MGFLGQYILQIDHEEGIVRLYSSSGHFPLSGRIALPLYANESGLPMLEGSIHGEKIRFYVATAVLADGALDHLTFQSLAARKLLKPRTDTVTSSNGEEYDFLVGNTDAFDIGPLTLSSVDFLKHQFNMIGLGVMRRLDITFDFNRYMLYVRLAGCHVPAVAAHRSVHEPPRRMGCGCTQRGFQKGATKAHRQSGVWRFAVRLGIPWTPPAMLTQ